MTAQPTLTGPAQAENTGPQGSRQYADPVTGARYPSVTSIISATSAKYGLMDWSAKMAAEFAVDHPQAWQPVMAAAGRQAAVDLIRQAADRHKDAAGDRGSFVHGAVEALILDQPLPSVEGEAAGLLDAFMEWHTDYDVDFWCSEITVANRTHGYAGTLDGGVTLGACSGRRLLVDIKTGRRVYPPEAGMQLAAYRNAEEVWLTQGAKDAMPDVDGIATLHLHDDRTYDFAELADDTTWPAFLAHLAQYEADRTISGRKALIGRVRRDDDPWFVTDLPSLNRVVKPLAAVGLSQLEQVVGFTDEDLLGIDGIGAKGVTALRAAIVACGIGVAS